jgi:hypothetical protein
MGDEIEHAMRAALDDIFEIVDRAHRGAHSGRGACRGGSASLAGGAVVVGRVGTMIDASGAGSGRSRSNHAHCREGGAATTVAPTPPCARCRRTIARMPSASEQAQHNFGWVARPAMAAAVATAVCQRLVNC